MAFEVKTKGNSLPNGKRRVYFSCHPEDFEKYFEEICEDIFKNQDVAVYYTPDMKSGYDDEQLFGLEQMSLYVIPVSYRLLSSNNRALDNDYKFATEKNIPILPIMLEESLNELYEAKFGKLEYIDKASVDITSISYEEKIKRFLNIVLIGDKMAERIRAAFDAYIFLSYRKKDRRHANDLMKTIHLSPMCHDIAIWYDEFLVPGENFEDSILAAMKKSRLFAMVVTPNLIEEGNYIQRIEYPEAKQLNLDIFPVEMEATDADKLHKFFDGIPETVSPADDEFYRRLAKVLALTGKRENRDDPEHNFLIGMAYLDGIDVEKDSSRALELITKAAEAGLMEAMSRLAEMYREGIGTGRDWNIRRQWLEKIWDKAEEEYYENDDIWYKIKNELADCYRDIGEYDKAEDIWENLYCRMKQDLGAEAGETLIVLNKLADVIMCKGNYSKALEMTKTAHESMEKKFGTDAKETLIALGNIAHCYYLMGDYDTAISYEEKVAETGKRVYGEGGALTNESLGKLVTYYIKNGDYNKAVELVKRLKDVYQDKFHPSRLSLLINVCQLYVKEKKCKKALDLSIWIYLARQKHFGAGNLKTIESMQNMAICYYNHGEIGKAIKWGEYTYKNYKRMLGGSHPDTLYTLHLLAVFYYADTRFFEAEKYGKDVCEAFEMILGNKHPYTIKSKNNYELYRSKLEEYEKDHPKARRGYLAFQWLNEYDPIIK